MAKPARPLLRWAAAGVGFLLPAAGSLWHILASRVPPAWDDAAYLVPSFILWDRFAGMDFLGVLAGFSKALSFKAPLIALQPFPVYLVAGKGFAQASASGLLALGALSWCVYRIGDRLRPPFGGPLAVWWVNLAPIVYGVSRHFYVETLLAALGAATVCCLLEGGRPKTLGILLGLGMLCKLTFPLYVGVPVLLLAFRRRSWRDWIWTAAVAAAVASLWYARNLEAALLFARSAGYGASALGGGGSSWGHLWLLVRQGWGWPLALAAAAAGIVLWQRGQRPGREAVALASWALLPSLVFSTALSPELRWSAPSAAGAGVCAALLLAAALEQVAERWRAGCAAAALALPLVVYAGQTFGCGAAVPYAWNGPPERRGLWGQDRLWALVAKDAASGGRSRSAVLAVSHRSFNASTANAYAALYGWPMVFHDYVRYPTAEAALRFIEATGAEYLMSVEGLPEAELSPQLNRHNPAVLAAVREGRLPFRQWAEADLPNGAKARVFKRVRR